MKSVLLRRGCVLIVIVIVGTITANSQETKELPRENFYNKSLHYTNKGISFIYSKEHGGLEKLTGLSAVEIGCDKAKCHATSCDACHKKEENGKASYSLDPAIAYEACKVCHGDLVKDNPDVHFAQGMKCMDCHTSREIHGDGIEYDTYLKPGFFDVKCENCHTSIKPTTSHTIHKEKMDCNTCHTGDYTTCLNCHIETRLLQKKDVSIPLKGMCFLINHGGEVTTGNMLSYVYKNKTMITFAKAFSHSIKKEGRKCIECHNTKIVKDIDKNRFKPIQWEKDTMKNIEGVIPALEGMKWNLVYLNKENDKWIPIKNPPEPLINYSGYCTPITKDQFEKLKKVQKGK